MAQHGMRDTYDQGVRLGDTPPGFQPRLPGTLAFGEDGWDFALRAYVYLLAGTAVLVVDCLDR